MFKNNISQIKSIRPLETLKDFISERLFEYGLYNEIEDFCFSDFKKDEVDYIRSILIRHIELTIPEVKEQIVNFWRSNHEAN